MEPNKILSASLIDVIFDGRNKAYGAYDLRKTYSHRTKVALSLTIAVVALVLTGTTLANSSKKDVVKNSNDNGIVVITEIKEVKPPEELPEPETKPEEPQQTQKFTEPIIVDKQVLTDPLPSITDLDSSAIGSETKIGKPDIGLADPPQGPEGDKKGIIQPQEVKDPDEIQLSVDVPAKFEGNWVRFLEKNLKAEVPVDNGAAPGRYSVVVQFVVDKEGNVSDIKALTNHGYGVEQEAIRVLKKAPKWQPAIAAGFTVKAYHRQVIVFEVTDN